ncbi:hypothetical protein, partial [Pedobacter borealis]|uniref:hypothetical protein n=1 Tax=Pedobacter borealis TaxID=475254 RepID=UPI000559E977
MRTLKYFMGIFMFLLVTRCQKPEVALPESDTTNKTTARALTATSYPSYNLSPLPPDQSYRVDTSFVNSIFVFSAHSLRRSSC